MQDELSLSPQLDAAINIPALLFELIAGEKDNISIFFIHYDDSTLFPVAGGQSNSLNTGTNISMRKEVGSTILAATVGIDLDFKDLEDEMYVTVLFRLKISEDKVYIMIVRLGLTATLTHGRLSQLQSILSLVIEQSLVHMNH